MVFRIADNGDASAAGNHCLTFRNAFLGIVGAFGVNVRTQKKDKLFDVRCVEDGYSVHVSQRGQQFRAFVIRNSRPALALERACAGIGINGHNQLSAQLFGGLQVSDVAHVKKIKTAVGEDYLVSRGAPLPDLLRQFGGG